MNNKVLITILLSVMTGTSFAQVMEDPTWFERELQAHPTLFYLQLIILKFISMIS